MSRRPTVVASTREPMTTERPSMITEFTASVRTRLVCWTGVRCRKGPKSVCR